MFILILIAGLTNSLLPIRMGRYNFDTTRANINRVIDHLIKAGLINQGAQGRSLKDVILTAWNRAEEIKAEDNLLLVNSRRHCLNVFMDLLELVSSSNQRYFDLDVVSTDSNDAQIKELTFISNSEVFVATFKGNRLGKSTPLLTIEIASKLMRNHNINLFIGYDTKGHKGDPPFCHLDISSNDDKGKWVRHCRLNGVWGTPEKVNNFIERLFLLLDRKAIAQSRLSQPHTLPVNPYDRYCDVLI